jgi:uncharacterized membrane-anchored protein YitT (DUF2179 family)
MEVFNVFFEVGLRHVLDINGYDHVLFLLVLTVPYSINEWKKTLLLITLFTLGHTISLLLSVFNIVTVKAEITELFILITILITALYNLFFAGKNLKNHNNSFIWITTLCFGIIHGLGFSNYFKTLVSSETPNKLATLFSFAIGIEVAQIIVAVAVLLLSFLTLTLSPLNKREFTLVASAFVLGVVVPLLLENPIFG